MRFDRATSILLAALIAGCASSYERPRVDAGPDAGPDTSCGVVGSAACCNFGMLDGCVLDADCDLSHPYCVAAVSHTVCAADPRCSRICASPDTPIATPRGEHAIAQLAVGDLVMSLDHGVMRAVRIVRVARTRVHHHAVVRVRLATGRVVEMSHGHPTADGRVFADLVPGDSLGGVSIVSVESIPYAFDATYDILPASDTGTYVAAGALVGSTLAAARRIGMLR